MSALSAIEAPVSSADARDVAQSDASGGEPHLRVIRGSARTAAWRPADCSIAGAQPSSSSIRQSARRQTRIRTDPNLTDPLVTGPILTGSILTGSISTGSISTGSILTGTVLAGRGRRSAPGASSQASPAAIRLTRRGRIVVAVLLVGVLSLAVLLVTALVSGGAQATNHGAPRAGFQGMHQIVVRSGQTLWSIATAADPTADPRNVVQEIMSANALGGTNISAGQLLWVP